jgi:hypothetical protein
MYCPKCGKPQATDGVRFCVKCGLPLESVTTLVTAGAVTAVGEKGSRRGQLSPRAKGVLQGVAIVPLSIGALLVLDIFYESLFGAGMMGGLYAVLTLILLVALARVLYAVFLEEGAARPRTEPAPPHGSHAEVGAPATTSALPAAAGEVASPLSIAESTTRQLETRQ